MAALSAAAPFAGDQLDQLDRLLGEAGSERLQWLSGDVAGFRAATAGNGKGGQGHDDPFPTGYDVAVCSIRRTMHSRNDMSERPMTTLFESRLLPGCAPSSGMPLRRFHTKYGTIGTLRATRLRLSRAVGIDARIMTLVGARAASPDSALPC